MSLFRRAVRLFLLIVGGIAGIITALSLLLTRFILRPPRHSQWATPRHFDMPYEEVQFPAGDGVRLAGWFVPAPEADGTPRPTLLLVHGWPWNRLGILATDPLNNLPAGAAIELLPLAHTLHQAGYNLLMPDLRNHGQSASAPPVTFGFLEANDVLGAVDYLQGRAEVDGARLGAIGFSMGANSLLFALPRTEALRAVVAVQPTTPALFSRRYARFLLGPLGGIMNAGMSLGFPLLSGGLTLSAINPAFAVSSVSHAAVLYVQGGGDPWGSADDVRQMADHTPRGEVKIVPALTRYDGYQYLVDQPELALAFFEKNL